MFYELLSILLTTFSPMSQHSSSCFRDDNPREPHDTIVLQYFTVSEEYIIMQQFHNSLINHTPSRCNQRKIKKKRKKITNQKSCFFNNQAPLT